MELIPIIENTLLIFIGLLIVVLFTSYILFLIKRKTNSAEANITNEHVEQNEVELEYQYLIPAETDLSYNNSFQSVSANHEVEYIKINSPEPKTELKNRFIILNNSAIDTPVYYPERIDSFNHRFSASRTGDAFAAFR